MNLFARLSIACAAAALLASAAVAAKEPEPSGGLVMRRLTPEQYRETIADIFGRSISLGGRFEPDKRVEGLMAVGTGQVNVTASGLEQYDLMARAIAAQVVSEPRRATLIPCKPASPDRADDACARTFFGTAGRLLYRRPLDDAELGAWVAVAGEAARATNDFYAGIGTSLANMLVSLPFLFRQEVAIPDPEEPGALRTDGYTTASRLSFFLWNAPPDEELLDAAARGDLNTKKGIARQADRLLASPRLEAGARAFFADMFRYSQFDGLSKDHQIYPKFTGQAAKDALEQTLRTTVTLLLRDHGDYRDLFTTRKTYLTPTLGALYGVPVPNLAAEGAPELWVPYEYPEGDFHAGILSQASFVSLHSHAGRSSPTIRGKALREIMLCQKVPDPPGNVNFDIADDTGNAERKTARARLEAHRTDPTCAGCHKLLDPIGLALENFDSAAALRTTENGEVIDTSGELDGIAFADAVGLGKAVRDNPATPSCLAKRLFSYAVGRPLGNSDAPWTKSLEQAFAANGYRLPELLRRIATSQAMYRISAADQTASAEPAGKEKP